MLCNCVIHMKYVISHIQGDEEKRQGIQPQSLMDRSLAHELPKNQVLFVFPSGFVLISCT